MTIEQMIARQQELLNAARSAGRNMTREEAAEFDSLQRSIDAARAAGAGIAHGGQSSTPAAPANNTPEGQRQHNWIYCIGCCIVNGFLCFHSGHE